MSVDYATDIMASLVGCAAGVSLAGLVAAIALSKVTRRIQARLAAAGLVCVLDSDAANAVLDPENRFSWSPSTIAYGCWHR